MPLTQDSVEDLEEDDEDLDDEENGLDEEEGEEEDAEEDGVEEAGGAPGGGSAGSTSSPCRRERRFKVVLGRVPVLSVPCAEQLAAAGASHASSFEHKKEFVADGALFLPAENRVYLRLRNGRGWICERSRNDIRKVAVVPVTRRKKQLSKKMAKAVAFRGGDTDGVTRLKKEDLVKNSAGKIVSKKASEAAKKRYADSSVSKWNEAVKKARTEMGFTGFVALKKGTPMYEKAREIYSSMTANKEQPQQQQQQPNPAAANA